MSTRQCVEQLNAVPEQSQTGMNSVLSAPVRENKNSDEQDPGLLARLTAGKSIEDWKVERLDGSISCSTQAVTSMISYKAQNEEFSESIQTHPMDLPALWAKAQEQLKTDLGTPAYETWLKPCRIDSLDGNTVTLATGSEFNRNIIHKRYGTALKQVFSALLNQAVTLRIVVDPTLAIFPSCETETHTKPTTGTTPFTSSQYPLARFQNPTNNPEVAILLEQYGDLRQVILKSPIFKVACAKMEEGGWGTGVGGLITLAKQYTLERVLWAIRETKAYRGTREPGKYFNHIVRKGLESDA